MLKTQMSKKVYGDNNPIHKKTTFSDMKKNNCFRYDQIMGSGGKSKTPELFSGNFLDTIIIG